MPRCVMHPHGIPAESQRPLSLVKEIDWRLGIDVESERHALLHHCAVEEVVVGVQPDRHPERRLRAADAGDVIQMRVGQQDVLDRKTMALRWLEQQIDVVSRVDDDALPGFVAPDHESVLHERRDRSRFKNHEIAKNAKIAKIAIISGDLHFWQFWHFWHFGNEPSLPLLTHYELEGSPYAQRSRNQDSYQHTCTNRETLSHLDRAPAAGRRQF